MRPTDMIEQKRQGESHSREDLEAFIQGYVAGDVPDYQVSAWLMAVCWQGMSPQETAELTQIMADSGDTLDLADLSHTVDKHSTGGVGDKTSLVLAPLLASCGATVAKMSGRGLGHTGGTIDKLESVPGFQTDISEKRFYKQAREVGAVITGQSKDLAPADGLLYSLRDATATVESLPLIASSIMSKKLAGGAKSIVLDVKVGSGAFMKTLDDARELASAMIDIGERARRNVRAVLSDMSEPLGYAVGNTLEVQEAMRCLKGEGPEDLRELCLTLAEQVLAASDLEVSREQLAEKLDNGEAFEKFKAWIEAQGGEVERLDTLELAPGHYELQAETSGKIAKLNALAIGQAVKVLGGGRSKKGDEIDAGVGIMLHAKVGTEVEEGEPIMTIYHRDERGLQDALALLEKAAGIIQEEVDAPPLIFETLP